jgi:hypothetical protein
MGFPGIVGDVAHLKWICSGFPEWKSGHISGPRINKIEAFWVLSYHLAWDLVGDRLAAGVRGGRVAIELRMDSMRVANQ